MVQTPDKITLPGLATRHTENAAKSDETGQKVSQFLISLNIVSSNGYSDYYLRHASRLVLASGAYRPKFRDYYREALVASVSPPPVSGAAQAPDRWQESGRGAAFL